MFYANRRWEDVTFREQLAELEESRPQLRVVHVLEEPHEDWTGETGRIDADLIRRHASVARWGSHEDVSRLGSRRISA